MITTILSVEAVIDRVDDHLLAEAMKIALLIGYSFLEDGAI